MKYCININTTIMCELAMEFNKMCLWGGPLPYFLIKSGGKLIKIHANQEDIKQNYTTYLSNFKNDNKTKYFNY